RWSTGDVEPRELPLAHEEPMSHVFDRILEGILREAKKRGAVLAVAGGEAAFRIHMHIAEAHVADCSVETHRGRCWPQSASHAIPVVVRDQNVGGITNLE